MITHDNDGGTPLFFLFGFIGGLFTKLLEIHFFETVLLALFCGFITVIGKNAGSLTWRIIANTIRNFKRK